MRSVFVFNEAKYTRIYLKFTALAPFLTELFNPDLIYCKSTLSPAFDKQLSGLVMQSKIF